MFVDIYHQTLSPEQIKGLAADTEGWITGLLLTGRHIADYIPDQAKATSVTGTDIFKYLATQVFYEQPEEIRDFLLQSSIFDEFNQELCEEVLGWPKQERWDKIILYLVKQNLFIQQINDQHTWIRYHNLFLEYLRENLKKSHPDLEKTLLSRLVNAYAQLSDWEQAYEVAIRLDDDNRLAQVIDLASPDLFHSGRIQLLASWLNELPKHVFEKFPTLKVVFGICNTSIGKPLLGRNQLNVTINQYGYTLTPELLTRAHLCRATTNRLLGDYNYALQDINFIQQIELENNLSNKIVAEYHREAGLIHNYLSNNKLSLEYLTKSLSLYESNFDKNNCSFVHSDLGLVHMDQGDLKSAEQHLLIAKELWISLNNNVQLSVVSNNLANLRILEGKYIEANSELCIAMEYANKSGYRRIKSYIRASIGDLALALSSFDICLEMYKKSFEISQSIQEGYLNSYLQIKFSMLDRLRGFGIKKIKFHGKSNYEIGLWLIEKGFSNIITGSINRGRWIFLIANHRLKNVKKPLDMANLSAGRALLEIKAGNLARARKYLQTAVEIIKGTGSNQPLLPLLARHITEFELILSTTTDPDLIQLQTDLLEFKKSLPALRKAIFPDQKIEPSLRSDLKIQAFGKTSLLLNGKKITASEWVHQKTVRELFYYLLTRSESVSKEQVGLHFWPDSSPSQLTGQFKNAIYRLRRSIGKDWILYDPESRCYAFNTAQVYSYDVKEFQDLVEDAAGLTAPEPRLARQLQALKIYRHPYGANLDGVWAEPIRRDLYLQYEQTALEAAEIMLGLGRFNESIRLCEDIILLEPCQEQAFQICMRSCAYLKDSIGLHKTIPIM